MVLEGRKEEILAGEEGGVEWKAIRISNEM